MRANQNPVLYMRKKLLCFPAATKALRNMDRARICFWFIILILRLRRIILRSMAFFSRFGTRRKCSPIENEILLYPAEVIREKILARQHSCLQVIESYISRIQEVNPIINAVVEDRFLDAIQDAKKVDGLIESNILRVDELRRKYPLLGVPMTVKESIGVKGLSNGAGYNFERKRAAPEDAEVVRLCREAGAIVLVVSNTPILCLSTETSNNVTGRTLNPYDTRRSPGGSSGGEGALIATGASVIGLGSDTGGSIRIPASWCGVWAHKSSPYCVSDNGHYPKVHGLEDIVNEVVTLGPLTRYATDMKLVLSVITRDNIKPTLRLDEQVCLYDIDVYYLDEYPDFPLTENPTDEIVKGIEMVVEGLKTKCRRAKEVEIPELDESEKIIGDTFLTIPIQNIDVEPSVQKVGCRVQAFGQFMSGKRGIKPTIYGRELKEKMINILGENGVFLYPVCSTPAPFYRENTLDVAYTSVFNVLGLPATSCPIGLNSSGLPLSIQIISGPNNDRLCLRLAEEIERLFGGWVPPTLRPQPPKRKPGKNNY